MSFGDMLQGAPTGEMAMDCWPARIVCGVDEAGRGPLAGPVVGAAAVLCKGKPDTINDSKTLSPARRALLEGRIRQSCAFGIGMASVAEIDRLNIFAATMLAMTRAVERLEDALRQAGAKAVEHVLVDGNFTPAGRAEGWRWDGRAIVGGDGLEECIGAASILAKEYRDRLMLKAAQDWPHYRWERNKGYGTAEHLAALREYGPSPLHRRSFAPVAQLLLPLSAN